MLNLYGAERRDPVRRGPRGRAPVLPAARQPEHGLLPRPRGEARLPGRRTSTTSARCSTSTRSNFIQELYDRAYSKKFRFQTFLGAFKYYTSLHAEDVRRQALPGALRGPRRAWWPSRLARRRRAARRCRLVDEIIDGPLPAGHPDVPQRRQGAARRAGLLLPAAHRRQHGVDRPLASTPRCSCPSAAAAWRFAADQHPRARRADQADREPVLRRHPRDEAARRQLLLRQPARCPPGRRRGVPARAPPRHLPVPRHQARERRREDPHQDALARRRHPGHHVRAGQEERGHVPVLAVRRRARLRRAVRRHLGHREVLRDGRRRRGSRRPRSRRASSSRRSPRSSSSPATRTSCSRTR